MVMFLMESNTEPSDFTKSVQDAIARERQRCLRCVAKAQPDTSGCSDMELQMMNGHDWNVALKRVINKLIASGEKA